MTLRTNGNNISTTTTTAMSSNTRVAAAARTGNGDFKVVHLGKDQRPISIMKLAGLNEPSWKRGATFNHLSKAIKVQLKNYTLADLVTVVANELPISTESAMEEAEGAGVRLMGEFFDIRNLEGSHFLDSRGKQRAVTSDELKNRPEDLSYFVFLASIDPRVVDTRITQEDFSTGFSLKLPLSMYDVTTGKVVEELGKRRSIERKGESGLSKLVGKSNPDVMQSLRKSLFAGGANGNSGDEAEDDSSSESPPATPASGNSAARTLGPTSRSPKMDRLLGTNSSKVATGYYGPLTFLDNQGAFNGVFGSDPSILPALPLQNGKPSKALREEIDRFIDACKLDVFIGSCKNYYVGVGNKESDTQATHAACNTINKLRMEYKANGRTVVDNPDVLFGKFMEFTPLLPDDASKWSTQLCSAFFNALTEDLRARMENDNFVMPSLNMLNFKKDQIDALQVVREKSSVAFKRLNDETTLITTIMTRNGHRRTGGQFVTEEETSPLPPTPSATDIPERPTAGVYAYGQRSPAEETMHKYSSRTPNPTNLPVKEGADGLLYPYREDEPSVISRFPLGFKGCFKCGVEAPHEDGFASCPRYKDPTAKAPFFKELWIHKPHTKTKEYPVRNLGTASNERNVSHHI